jgi:hypothetical protein
MLLILFSKNINFLIMIMKKKKMIIVPKRKRFFKTLKLFRIQIKKKKKKI